MENLDELDNLAEKYKSEGNFVEALNVVEEGLNIRKTRFGDDSLEVRKSYIKLCELCNILAAYYLQRDNADLAFDLLKRAELLCEMDEHTKAVTYNNLACYYRKTGKARVALTYLGKALVIDNDQPNTHLNLCASLSQIDRHEKALGHAMQAIVLLQDLFISSLQANTGFEEHAHELAIAYHNMAVELEYLKRTNEALRMYQKAVEFAQKYLPEDHPINVNAQRMLYNAAKDEEEHREKLLNRRECTSKNNFYSKKLDRKESRREIDEDKNAEMKRKASSTDPGVRFGRDYERGNEGRKPNLIEI
ncbi:unnamed protein product [Blepharisma stoltei]|uniref:Kinesin light chain n=1 Tax=Blepharisma stoltei TaxID=1481888 RepID=A0AAU9K3K0_9CILI|nr:unnamed protein product [Blepharisma stoltei]